MHDQGCGRDVSPKMGSETIFSWHSWKQVRREHENDNKEVYFVDEFLAVPDTNTLIVNIELTKNENNCGNKLEVASPVLSLLTSQ